MSNIEVTIGKVSEPQPRAENQLTNKPSPGATAKAGKSKRSGTKENRRTRQTSLSTKPSHTALVGSKQDSVIGMLRRQCGASIDDIVVKTGWEPHSARGFLSGIVRKKLKLSLVSELGKDGVRRYHVGSGKSSKG